MSKRALVTTAAQVPTHVKTWTTVGLDDRDVIIVLGQDTSPHEEITTFLDTLPNEDDIEIIYLPPQNQTRWKVSTLSERHDITQRMNVGVLEALNRGVKTITLVGEGVYPVTTDFFSRVKSTLNGSAPYTLVSSKTGWWNVGSLSDAPVTVRGFPMSQRHIVPELVREVEVEHALRPAVISHQVLGDPDVDAVEQITQNPQVGRFRSDTNILLASGTWCPFSFRSATTFTRRVAPLMFIWPYVGRYDDIWASFLAQRAMQDLGCHVVFGMPLVRRESMDQDLLVTLGDELVGMRHSDNIVDTLRNAKIDPCFVSMPLPAAEVLDQLSLELTANNLAVGVENRQAFLDWQVDLGNLDL